jgi:hypothetical protein
MLPVELLQLLLVLSAMIVFFRTGSFPAVVRRSPPPPGDVLLLIVTFVSVSVIPGAVVAVVRIPPPAPEADVTSLSEIVTLVNVALCALFSPPPLNPFAKLPWMTLFVIVRKPLLAELCTPPPSLEEMLFGPIVLSLIVSVPALLTPPPLVVETLSLTTTRSNAALAPFPFRKAPPPDELPFCIVRSDIVTPVIAGLTSKMRLTSFPSTKVEATPAPSTVTFPVMKSMSPTVAFGARGVSAPAIVTM